MMISGCPLKCSGCHSSYSWNQNLGSDLTVERLSALLDQYSSYITCVVFLGGDWDIESLEVLIETANQRNLKTCLYTGLNREEVPAQVREKLDYLKYGPYIKELGGLDSPITNQRLLNLKTNELLNSYFISKEGINDSHKSTTGTQEDRIY